MKKPIALALCVLFPLIARAADVGYTIISATPYYNYNASSFNNFEINSTTDQIEYLFQCQTGCAITDLGYLYGVRSGTPCAQQISLQGVTSAGRADGTIKASGNAKASFTPPASTADDGVWKWRTLTSSYTCTGGEYLAAVIGDVSDGCTPTTVTAASSYSYNNNNWPGQGFPHAWTFDSTGSVSTSQAGPAPYGYKCSSAVYGNPIQTVSNFNFGSDSTPDERGNYFKVPATSCSTFKLAGVTLSAYVNNATSTATIKVYSGLTSTAAVSGAIHTLDTDVWRGLGSNNMMTVYFNTPPTLTCGSDYVVAFAPASTGGTAANIEYAGWSASGDLSAVTLGTSMYYASRTDANSTWTTDNTKRTFIDLIVSDITAPTAGGIKNQNMTSGGAQ